MEPFKQYFNFHLIRKIQTMQYQLGDQKTEELKEKLNNNQLLPFFDSNRSRIFPHTTFIQMWWCDTAVQNAQSRK